MGQDNNIYKYRVSDPEDNWSGFVAEVHKGKLISCKGVNHPAGSDWKSLSGYYEKIGAKIELVKEEDEFSN